MIWGISFLNPFEEIKSIKMRIKEGINPKRQLIMCLLDSREIPLTGIEQPVALNEIENEAITITKEEINCRLQNFVDLVRFDVEPI